MAWLSYSVVRHASLLFSSFFRYAVFNCKSTCYFIWSVVWWDIRAIKILACYRQWNCDIFCFRAVVAHNTHFFRKMFYSKNNNNKLTSSTTGNPSDPPGVLMRSGVLWLIHRSGWVHCTTGEPDPATLEGLVNSLSTDHHSEPAATSMRLPQQALLLLFDWWWRRLAMKTPKPTVIRHATASAPPIISG